jgi:hypothetical protein
MSKIISLIKRIIRNITPPLIITTFKTIKRKTQKSYSKKVNLDIAGFQSFEDTEVYILGNSPSLSQVNVEDFFGKTIFVCNHFYKHPKFNQLKEKCKIMYFAQDPIQSHINISTARNLELIEVVCSYFDNFLSESYETIVEKSVYDYFKLNDLYSDCKISFFNYNAIFQYFDGKLNSDNLNLEKAIKIRHTPNAMITYALIYGFRKIYLHGLQHSYIKDKVERLKLVPHFYEESKVESESMENVDFTQLFLDEYLTFSVYKEQSKLAKQLNVSIYDFTIDGMLDMFNKG